MNPCCGYFTSLKLLGNCIIYADILTIKLLISQSFVPKDCMMHRSSSCNQWSVLMYILYIHHYFKWFLSHCYSKNIPHSLDIIIHTKNDVYHHHHQSCSNPMIDPTHHPLVINGMMGFIIPSSTSAMNLHHHGSNSSSWSKYLIHISLMYSMYFIIMVQILIHVSLIY